MQEELHVTKENFKKVQRKGKQTVRLVLLLFLLFLTAFFILNYFLLENMLTTAMMKEVRNTYLLYGSIELILWFLISLQLWHYSRLGRILFTIFSVLILYGLKDSYQLFSLSMNSLELQMMRILFFTLCIGKNMFALSITWQLYRDKSIRCIWSLYDLYDGHLTALDQTEEESTSLIIRKEVLENYEEKETQLNRKASRYLRRYLLSLILLTYGSFLIIYLLLYYLEYMYPKELESLQYVQRILLLATLFTILAWSLPMISMFLKKRWSRFLIPLAWGIEFLRLAWNLPQILHTFQTQKYGLIALVTMFLIETVRYVLLLRFTRSFYCNPFMKVYWEKQAAILHQKNKLLDRK